MIDELHHRPDRNHLNVPEQLPTSQTVLLDVTVRSPFADTSQTNVQLTVLVMLPALLIVKSTNVAAPAQT